MNTQPIAKRLVRATIIGAAISVASVAQAADARLDSAEDFLVKAKALVAAAEDPGARRPFGGHAAKAIAYIEKAEAEIALAKQAANP